MGRMSFGKDVTCKTGSFFESSLRFEPFRTVSAIAMTSCLALGPHNATADDNQGRFIVEFSGSSYSGDQQPWNQFGPNHFNTIRPGFGLNGMIGYIGPMGGILPFSNNSWDVGVFARFGSTNKETEAGYGSPYYNILGGNFATPYSIGNATHREEHLIVDFEARSEVGLGSRNDAQTTLISGLRFAHFEVETNTTFITPPLTFILTEDREFTFTGIGPKIGVDHVRPINSHISLDLSGSASLLYGRRSTDVSAVGCVCGINSTTHQERFDWVPMVEGRVGVTFSSPHSPTQLSIGIEGSAWFGVFDQRAALTVAGAPIPGNENADRYSYGPYVRLTTLLGGQVENTFAYSRSDFDTGSGLPQRQAVLELGAWGGHLWRFGNALNGSGDPRTEIEDFALGGVEVLAAIPFATNWLTQIEAYGEATFNNNRLGQFLADETYGGGHLTGGHLDFVTDSVLFGVFGGFGRTEINNNDGDSLDTQFEFGGVEGRFLSSIGSLAFQAGFLNGEAHDNNESFDDAIFARAIGQLFFNDGKTLVQGELGYADGLQDSDDFVPNPATVFSWGIELEHQLPIEFGSASTSFFVSFEGLRVEEKSTDGSIDRVEESTLLAGLKFRFGAPSPYDRAFNSAPDLPNVMRWLGAVPAVD